MRILLGASGAGKSVLLKLILGLLPPDSGRIFVNGQRIDDLSERQLLQMRADIGMLFQENALFDSLTVAENVGYRLSEDRALPPDEVRTRVEEVLALIGLSDCIDRMPSTLSGGQRRRAFYFGRIVESSLTTPGEAVRYFTAERTTWSIPIPSSRTWTR